MSDPARSDPAGARGRISGDAHLMPVRVYWEDTDAGAIVYYANYLKFTERARSDMLRLLGPRYGIDPEAVVEFTVQMPNFGELNSPIYMHTVIPNLRNLGLITERTREQWIDAGMLYPGTAAAS